MAEPGKGAASTKAAPTDWHEELRSRGYRVTPQRQLVLEAVSELGHATPEEICARVQQTARGVNISTVYRTLELLEELGLVTHTHLSHGAPTYHLAAEADHVHLACRGCGEVTDRGLEPLPELPVARAVWEPRPDLGTSTESWLTAGGPHHTALSLALTSEHLWDLAEMTGTELALIDGSTTTRRFTQELRWSQAYHRLAQGF